MEEVVVAAAVLAVTMVVGAAEVTAVAMEVAVGALAPVAAAVAAWVPKWQRRNVGGGAAGVEATGWWRW